MSSKPIAYPSPPAWLAGIPGYAGYHAKEQRRQADRALRDDLRRRVSLAVQTLQRLSGSLAAAGRYAELGPIDGLTSRLQHLADRLQAVPEGYRGLFNQERVDEAVLDQLIAFDGALAAGIDRLGTLTTALSVRTAPPLLESPAGQELVELTERLHERLDARSSVVSEAQPVAAGQAIDVLADPARPGPAPRYIKIGDAVGYRGTDYLVDAIINYGGARSWSEYRLRDGERQRWLLVLPGQVALLEPLIDPGVVKPTEEAAIQLDGQRYTQQASGQAQATLGGPSGQQQLAIAYRDYHDGQGGVVAVREWGGTVHAYRGEVIDAALIEVYART